MTMRIDANEKTAFSYHDPFPLGEDKTKYRLLTK